MNLGGSWHEKLTLWNVCVGGRAVGGLAAALAEELRADDADVVRPAVRGLLGGAARLGGPDFVTLVSLRFRTSEP